MILFTAEYLRKNCFKMNYEFENIDEYLKNCKSKD